MKTKNMVNRYFLLCLFLFGVFASMIFFRERIAKIIDNYINLESTPGFKQLTGKEWPKIKSISIDNRCVSFGNRICKVINDKCLCVT